MERGVKEPGRFELRAGSWDEEGRPSAAEVVRREVNWYRASLGVIGVIFFSGLCAWFWFRETPTYSLLQLRKAIEARDAETAMRYIDVDAVVDGMFASAGNGGGLSSPGRSSPEAFAEAFAQGMVAMMGTVVKEGIRTGLRRAITVGDDNNTLLREFLGRDGAGMSVSQDGDAARVTLSRSRTVLLMRRAREGGWRIVGVEGLERAVKGLPGGPAGPGGSGRGT